MLGSLPPDTKQALEEINIHSQDRLSLSDAQRRDGKSPDQAELAKIRQQTRAELQKVLAPAQLEEFLLRYSESANELRAELGQLKYFNASPDEFRAIFRSADLINEQIQLLAGATDVNSVAQRKNLEDQRENAIKVALGNRYEDYRLLHDPLYRDAVASARQAGQPESAFLISIPARLGTERIRLDPNLTRNKSDRTQAPELEQLKANTAAAGQELPPTHSAGPRRRKTYVVRPGDNASVVSMIHGVHTRVRPTRTGIWAVG